MGVIVHAPEPERQPSGIGFQNRQPEFRKLLQNPGENEMAQSRHIVAGKSKRVVETPECKLNIFATLALQFSKWMETPLPVFTVGRDWKIQLAGELPQRIVFRFVQMFAYRKKRISHRYGAELDNRAARLFNHLADIRTGQYGNEFKSLGIGAAVLVAPVVVGAAHGSAEFGIL